MLRRLILLLALVLTFGAVAAAVATARRDADPSSSGKSSGDCVSTAERRPVAKGVPVVGIASFNVDRTRRPRHIWADMRRLAAERSVDVIGWQEADSAGFQESYPRLARRGWSTQVFEVGDGSLQIPISWRTGSFELVDTAAYLMVDGASPDETDHPFRPKWTTAVTLRHRASGRVFTMMNTHVPNHIETGQEWEQNINASYARVHYERLADLLTRDPDANVVAVGDLQWDHHDDLAARPEGGITDTFEGRVVSSYDALGLEGLCPTRNTRWIDYVLVPKSALEAKRMRFVGHTSLAGFGSDHRPMVAWIRLG